MLLDAGLLMLILESVGFSGSAQKYCRETLSQWQCWFADKQWSPCKAGIGTDAFSVWSINRCILWNLKLSNNRNWLIILETSSSLTSLHSTTNTGLWIVSHFGGNKHRVGTHQMNGIVYRKPAIIQKLKR